MSSFRGRMQEYPTISLDRFDFENLHARAYFLSHCHEDHMKGLKSLSIKRRLKSSLTVKLYCSHVTRDLLLSNPKYGFWENYIVALELENPTRVSLIDEGSGEKEDIVITLLPAGHCPGSVMFLIEGTQGTVLYTGDFRLAQGDAARMEPLHTGSRIKDIQSVYLDTTFLDPRFFHIPSREACLEGIRELVREWISLSPYHVVWLNCKAAYGYEFLFVNLCEEFGCQIHVRNTDAFQKMPEIQCHMTTSRATQIHACRRAKGEEVLSSSSLPCGMKAPDGMPLHVISITPSTLWFGEMTQTARLIIQTGSDSYRACFSFHSSYSEIIDFLSYFSPVNIYPNVIPLGKTLEDVQEILKPFCREQHGRGAVLYKPLGTLKRAKVECLSEDRDSDCNLFDDEDFTPWRRKVPDKHQPKLLRSPIPENTAPTNGLLKAPSPLPARDLLKNVLDCTESNDNEDDEEDEDNSSDDQRAYSCKEQSGTGTGQVETKSPTWDTFFTPDPLEEQERAELDSSQRSLASQSPKLFSESDDSILTWSQSTHVSDLGTDGLVRYVPHPDGGRQHTEGLQKCEPRGEVERRNNTDFVRRREVRIARLLTSTSPMPESQAPQMEDLKEIYRKLATGEPLLMKSSQESI